MRFDIGSLNSINPRNRTKVRVSIPLGRKVLVPVTEAIIT
jgi:hypothetical protein